METTIKDADSGNVGLDFAKALRLSGAAQARADVAIATAVEEATSDEERYAILSALLANATLWLARMMGRQFAIGQLCGHVDTLIKLGPDLQDRGGL